MVQLDSRSKRDVTEVTIEYSTTDGNKTGKISQTTIHDCSLEVAAALFETYPPLDSEIADAVSMVCTDPEVHNFGLADGCGWGESAVRAAQSAVRGFVQALENGFTPVESIDIASQSIDTAAIEAAHQRKFDADDFPRGGTTLVGGRLSQSGFDYAAVGDCKLYQIRKEDDSYKVIADPLSSQRPDSTRKTRTGGRLGDNQNLDNLTAGHLWVKHGDIIVMCSDGLHDNLDPEVLKLPLHEAVDKVWRGYVDLDSLPDTWEALQKDTPEFCQEVRQLYAHQVLCEHIKETAHETTQSLAQYCFEVTDKERTFMVEKRHAKPPEDIPGKVDHVSIIVIMVSDEGYLTKDEAGSCVIA